MLTVSSVERRQATRRCEKIDFCVLGLLKNQQLTGAEIAIFQFFHSFPFPTCEFSPLDRLREDGRVVLQINLNLVFPRLRFRNSSSCWRLSLKILRSTTLQNRPAAQS